MIFQEWQMGIPLPKGNLVHFQKPYRAISKIKLHTIGKHICLAKHTYAHSMCSHILNITLVIVLR